MVQWKVQQELVGTTQDVIEIANESLYGTLLRILEKIYKNGVKGANACKICRLKKKVRVKVLVQLVMHKRVKTSTINAFEVGLMMRYRVYLIIHLESHLKMHL